MKKLLLILFAALGAAGNLRAACTAPGSVPCGTPGWGLEARICGWAWTSVSSLGVPVLVPILDLCSYIEAPAAVTSCVAGSQLNQNCAPAVATQCPVSRTSTGICCSVAGFSWRVMRSASVAGWSPSPCPAGTASSAASSNP